MTATGETGGGNTSASPSKMPASIIDWPETRHIEGRGRAGDEQLIEVVALDGEVVGGRGKPADSRLWAIGIGTRGSDAGAGMMKTTVLIMRTVQVW